ncbi:MAG TPA: preprotein translocase subunit SecE [Chthonomonadales bacterium]|nr:preprotein translocase subunit SecE [Chthonomonadales bacterium]
MAVDRQVGPKVGGAPATRDQGIQRSRNYISEVWTEMKKTTWPTREEATRLTLVVIVVIVVLGFYMGFLDWVLSSLVSKFSLIR